MTIPYWTPARRVVAIATLVVALAHLLVSAPAADEPQPAALQLVHVGADTDAAFRVVATIIVGPTESVLWDAQYTVTDGRRLADRIAATGTRLKAILISHADHDHYMGAMEVLKRFPNTPVYMAASTLADYRERSPQDLAAERSRPGADAPEALVSADVAPPMLTIDGHRLELIEDLVGDVRKPASSVLWIPSLQAALVSDLAFSGVHPWLGDADMASRKAWIASLQRIAGLNPKIVVAGHKADVTAPDSPEVLAFMNTYLSDFDRLMASATTPEELAAAMRQRYPDLRIPQLMMAGARRHFKK